MNVRHQLPPRGSIAKAAKRELTRLVRLRSAGESGFTLIEMLVTFLIIPVLIGAATFSLIGLMKGHATVANRLTSSADAQVVSSSYFNDLQSASLVTLDSSSVISPVVCTPNLSNPPNLPSGDAWLLGLQIPPASPGQPALDVSYGLVPSSTYGNVSTWALVRWQCSIGDQGQVNYDSMTTLASHVPSSSLNVSISGASCSPTASGSECLTNLTTPTLTQAAKGVWISTYGIQAVTIDVVDTGLSGTGGGWSYSLGANPRNWIRLVKCPSGQGLCSQVLPIQSPGLVLGLGGDSSTTSFQGNPCSISATAVGLNNLTISKSGNSNPFSGVTSIYGTGYPKTTTIYLGPGHENPLTINYASTSDPLAYYATAQNGLTLLKDYLGYTSIVYLESSWPTTFTAGTIYVIGPTTPTTIPAITVPSGGSILLWSDAAANPAAPPQLIIQGRTEVNLGSSGILYAPNTTLSVAGTAKIAAQSVIVQNLTCNGGGTSHNLILSSSYPNA